MQTVNLVVKRRNRLIDILKSSAGCDFLSGDSINAAAEAAITVLPKGCKYDAVYRSLLPLLAKHADDDVRKVCWSLAADVESLRAGLPVAPGRLPNEPTELVVQVVANRRMPSKRASNGNFPVLFRVQSMVGFGAPHRFDFVCSSKFLSYLATQPNGIGYAGRPKFGHAPQGRPYKSFRTYVGMRFAATVLAQDKRASVTKFRCSGAMREFNRKVMEMRWRQGFTCPFGFTHHCHDCPKGQNSCPAAVRPLDLVDQLCPACTAMAPHDPFWNQNVCVTCASKGRKRDS